MALINNNVDVRKQCVFTWLITYYFNFCVKGLQCVLSTVGIPSSILLKAVMTVSEAAQKQSEYNIKSSSVSKGL